MDFDVTETKGPKGRARRTQLRDEVASHIRQLVISGGKRPGAWLPLDGVAKELDVSVTPVREALLLLVQDGWVIQEHNRGFRVAPLIRRDIEDAYLVHSFASGELAARAASRINPAIAGELQRLDSEICRDPGTARASRLNRELHERINQTADSPRLSWFVQSAARFVPRRFWPTIPGWREMNDHSKIVAAIIAGDERGARMLMRDHILQAGRLLVQHLLHAGVLAEEDKPLPRVPARRRPPLALAKSRRARDRVADEPST